MNRISPKALLTAGILAVFAVLLIVPQVLAKDIVIFSAEWCASCRQINPIVQSVGADQNIPVHIIDVDIQDAPQNAQQYGLTIPKAELPQVYLVDSGHVTLLYDGRDFSYGKMGNIKSIILTNLVK